MGQSETGPFSTWGMKGKQGRRQGRKGSARDVVCFCGVYTAIIGLCDKFDSLYRNVAQRSRKIKRLLDNLNISEVHFLYDDLNSLVLHKHPMCISLFRIFTVHLWNRC